MSKCKRCNIDILDHTLTCPLCNGVLEQEHTDNPDAENEYYESKSMMYPDISPQIKKMKLAIKITVFSCILIEPVLILINYLTSWRLKWSLIAGAAMIYACFTMIHFFRNHSSHRLQMLIQAFCIMLLSILIDFFLGYTGWSFDFAIPCTIMALEIVIGVFMIFDRNNWQSYILLQISAMITSLLITLLIFAGLFHWPLLMFIADAVTIIAFGATLVFGDKRAITELKRRFRI